MGFTAVNRVKQKPTDSPSSKIDDAADSTTDSPGPDVKLPLLSEKIGDSTFAALDKSSPGKFQATLNSLAGNEPARQISVSSVIEANSSSTHNEQQQLKYTTPPVLSHQAGLEQSAVQLSGTPIINMPTNVGPYQEALSSDSTSRNSAVEANMGYPSGSATPSASAMTELSVSFGPTTINPSKAGDYSNDVTSTQETLGATMLGIEPGSLQDETQSQYPPNHPRPPPAPADPTIAQYTVQLNGNSPYTYPQLKTRSNTPLQMSTVLRKQNLSRQDHTRIRYDSSLADCVGHIPIYCPSVDEFSDPFRLLSSISSEGKKYGAVKIVPPESWNPPFTLDTEMFWFKTRRQVINSQLGDGTQINQEFIAHLYGFHKRNGTPINKVPSIDKRPLDLFRLHQCVQLRGGLMEVCKKKLWAQIGRELGYSGKIMTSLSTSLRTAYQKFLYPYDLYVDDVKSRKTKPDGSKSTTSSTLEGSPPLDDSVDFADSTNYNGKRGELSEKDLRMDSKRPRTESPESLTDELATMPGSVTPDIDAGKAISTDDRQHRVVPLITNSHPPLIRLVPDDRESFDGEICPSSWHGNMTVPTDPHAKVRDAPVYNLRQFQQKADCFRERYFQTGLADTSLPTDSDIEREFWQLVSQGRENIELEYGAYIPTAIHGSAFPHPEKEPFDPAAYDPWNLHWIPFHEKSLYRFSPESVPHMTSPYVHVGTLFSSESWHTEDYFSYEFNYHHFGDTKTWYTIPESQSQKMRDLLKLCVGLDKLEFDPSLILESDCMPSPRFLKDNGIDCYCVDQKPGEFVIVFPKAYSANFCHGFNLTESVSAIPVEDWLPYGHECDLLYKECGVDPPFSLHRLLLSIATDEDGNYAAAKASEQIVEMCANELATRSRVKSLYPDLLTIISQEEYLGRDDLIRCKESRSLCLLSRVVDLRSGDVLSLKSFLDLHVRLEALKQFRLVKFNEDDDLAKICRQVTELAEAPDMWSTKIAKLLSENPRPSMKIVKSLIAEGERLPFQVLALGRLKKSVADTNKWSEDAQSIITRKSHIRRHGGMVQQEAELTGNQYRSPEHFQMMLERSYSIPFWSTEVGQLHDRAKDIQKYRRRLHIFLRSGKKSMTSCSDLLEVGKGLNVDLPETQDLELQVLRMKWSRETILAMKRSMDLEEVHKWIEDGKVLGFSSANEGLMYQLEELFAKGQQLEERVKSLLTNRCRLPDLDALSNDLAKLPLSRPVRSQIRTARHSYNQKLRHFEQVIESTRAADIDDRPAYRKVRRMIEEAEALAIIPDFPNFMELQNCLYEVDNWTRIGKKLFGKSPSYSSFAYMLQSVERRLSASFSLKDLHDDQGRVSDPQAGTDLDSGPVLGSSTVKSEKLFCICRLAESGLMVECDHCGEWYHTKCLKLGKEQAMPDKFLCPICDWSTLTPRDCRRPNLTELQVWQEGVQSAPLQPEGLSSLRKIISICESFRGVLVNAKQRCLLGKTGLGELRLLLKKLEGGDVSLPENYSEIRQEILALDPSVNRSANATQYTTPLTSGEYSIPTESKSEPQEPGVTQTQESTQQGSLGSTEIDDETDEMVRTWTPPKAANYGPIVGYGAFNAESTDTLSKSVSNANAGHSLQGVLKGTTEEPKADIHHSQEFSPLDEVAAGGVSRLEVPAKSVPNEDGEISDTLEHPELTISASASQP